MEKIIAELVVSELETSKHSAFDPDYGNATLFGLSSNVYNDNEEVRTAIETRDLTFRDRAVEILASDYVSQIHGHSILSARHPWLLWFLSAGRIHGVGDELYTQAIQTCLALTDMEISVDGIFGPQTFNALFSTSANWVDQVLYQCLQRDKPNQIERRVQSCRPELARGITFRVEKEYAIAASFLGISGGTNETLHSDRVIERVRKTSTFFHSMARGG